jgi:hypothetical protein
MPESSHGFMERISWQAILAGIITAVTVFFAFPDYLLNIRPKIAEKIGWSTLTFVEGAIFGAVITVLVLKIISDRNKNKEISKRRS